MARRAGNNKNKQSGGISREDLRIFDLTDAEADTLITLIEEGPLSVSALARKSRVPRTTVAAVLKRLRERGFTRKLPDNYLSRWKIKDFPKIQADIREALDGIKEERAGAEAETAPPQKQEVVGEISADDVGIRVFRGLRQVKRAYEQMLSLSRAERVYFIQGNQAAETDLTAIEEEYFASFHKRFKERGIIIEGIAGEKILDILRGLNASLLRSHMDRLLIGQLVPDDYMDFNLDIFVMRNTAFFVSVSREIVIEVRFQPIVDALLHIADALSALGRRVDFNAFLRDLIGDVERAK